MATRPDSLTRVEQVLRGRARELLGWREGWLVEAVVFVAKQAWAAIFGGLMLGAFLLARLYPDDAALARSDLLVLVAVVIQVVMVLTRLETLRELRVVILFHLVGTVMELFKTAAGSWDYPLDGVLRIAEVPLYSGFMYAAVGSYMVRVHRLFDLRFDRWPPGPATALVAAAIYANFFTHHWWVDLRWVLTAAVLLLWARSVMHVRVHRRELRMPVLVSFALVALVIWLAENIATFAGAWLYPAQAAGWSPVHPEKVSSWFLLMIISVVLVTWVYPPQPVWRSVAVSPPARGGTAAASPTTSATGVHSPGPSRPPG